MLIASTFLLWVAVAVLGIAVLALVRQVGILHERIAPTGVPVGDAGPLPGDPAPQVQATRREGTAFAIGGGHIGTRHTLLMFVAAECPACRRIVPLAKRVAAAEGLDLVFAGDGADGAIRAMVDRDRLGDYPVVGSAEVGLAFRVGKLPHAVMIRPDGVIAARGVVSSRRQLERLVGAEATGGAAARDHVRSPGSGRKGQVAA